MFYNKQHGCFEYDFSGQKKMKIVGENIENKNEQIQRIICIM